MTICSLPWWKLVNQRDNLHFHSVATPTFSLFGTEHDVIIPGQTVVVMVSESSCLANTPPDYIFCTCWEETSSILYWLWHICPWAAFAVCAQLLIFEAPLQPRSELDARHWLWLLLLFHPTSLLHFDAASFSRRALGQHGTQPLQRVTGCFGEGREV